MLFRSSDGPESNQGYFPVHSSYVVNVASDATMYVVNPYYGNGSTSTPSGFYNLPGWQAGDCGYSWGSKFLLEDPGATPYSYPTIGGLLNGIGADGGNGPPAFSDSPHLINDFFFAANTADYRPVNELAIHQGYEFDFEIRHYLNYQAGSYHSGTNYSFGTVGPGSWNVAALLSRGTTGASPAYPSMDLTGPWKTSSCLWKMFTYLPDFPNGNYATINYGGGQNLQPYVPQYFMGHATDGCLYFAPASQSAQFYRNFLETAIPSWTEMNWGSPYIGYAATTLMVNQPTIGSVMPHSF